MKEFANEPKVDTRPLFGASESCVGPIVPSFAGPTKIANKIQKETAPMKLKVGDTAPDFTLLAFDGKDLKKVSLQDYKGKKNVALAFLRLAFTGG
jgi:hypothetical protein